MSINFGRDICSYLDTAESREWLVTNGIGGYASGTIAGLLTRKYHGLLVAALKPPLGRHLLIAKLDETASNIGGTYSLYSNRWANGTVDPPGYRNIESFRLEGTIPVWNFACGDAILEKHIWMRQGSNTTYIRYKLKRASSPLDLEIKALVNYRDYHSTTQGNDWQMRVDEIDNGVRIIPYADALPFFLFTDKAKVATAKDWYVGFNLSQEEYRGLDHIDDNFHAATLSFSINPGESIIVILSTEGDPNLNGEEELALRHAYEQELTEKFKIRSEQLSSKTLTGLNQLALAADQFIVSRPQVQKGVGKSIIAGYHWFGDWGRDTMISLPGLTLSTGRPEIARSILETFAKFVDKGMLPNRFPDGGEEPEYNNVDGTLWYFQAINAYYDATGDNDLLEFIFPILEEIIDWHYRGTRYNIGVDTSDGLLYAGEEGVQLTWMDAKINDWVVTPRTGKAIEVNALWYSALRSMVKFAKLLKKKHKNYELGAKRALKGFARFWDPEKGYCYDVIDGPNGNDSSLRPNQIIAVSLPESPLSRDQQQKVVEVCAIHLLTSHGLRSLSPEHQDYHAHYGGDQHERDSAYHQGTVWGWLIGPFALAHLRVYNDPEEAKDILKPIMNQLLSHGIGTLSEIFDGNAPMTPRGCIAQAWTVAEVIRSWVEIKKAA
ncbi:MAG: amylo-alpha-1,6-glucosidase [Thermodesulfobacteriota bacterium]